jgi:type I restriction enzyme, S subunit
MTAGYPVGTLAQACSFIGDGTHESPERTATGVPVLSAQNIQHGRLVPDTSRYTSVAEYQRFRDRVALRRGDVLMTIVGSLGRVALLEREEPLVFQRSVAILRPDPAKADARFLFYALQRPSMAREIQSRANKSAQAGIYLTKLSTLPIPLPPLSQQRRIAAILDKADTIRHKRQQALQLTDDLLRAAFLDMFGDPVTNPRRWPQLQIGEVADVQGGLQVTSARQRLELEVPYLRVANVFRERLDLTEVKSIRVTSSELSRTALSAGDILLVEGHGNRDEIGRASTWDGSIEPCVHQNHLIRVRLDRSRAEPLFVSAFLNSIGGRRQLVRFGKTTSGLNTISTAQVKRLRVPVPPLDLQQTWTRLSGQTETTRQAALGAIDEGTALFDALVQRAFLGEL